MGFNVAKAVNGRLGRTILELGGNNALIVAPSADINMATQSIFFGAVGTAGQRCTSLRRLFLDEFIGQASLSAAAGGSAARPRFPAAHPRHGRVDVHGRP